jgi:hypothetical protein
LGFLLKINGSNLYDHLVTNAVGQGPLPFKMAVACAMKILFTEERSSCGRAPDSGYFSYLLHFGAGSLNITFGIVPVDEKSRLVPQN